MRRRGTFFADRIIHRACSLIVSIEKDGRIELIRFQRNIIHTFCFFRFRNRKTIEQKSTLISRNNFFSSNLYKKKKKHNKHKYEIFEKRISTNEVYSFKITWEIFDAAHLLTKHAVYLAGLQC